MGNRYGLLKPYLSLLLRYMGRYLQVHRFTDQYRCVGIADICRCIRITDREGCRHLSVAKMHKI